MSTKFTDSLSGLSNVRMQSSSIFPEEIIVDILSRLPVKSIGRCRCVSKPWRTLLSQPQFIRNQLDRARKLQEQSLILICDSRSLYTVPLRNAHHLFDEITVRVRMLCFAGHPNSLVSVIASCDGLVLVGDLEHKMFLINPVTREIRDVPPSPFPLDPGTIFIRYGFGYDSINDDYKIITLSYHYPDYSHELDGAEMFVNVYSLKNDIWKKAESFPYDHGCFVTSGVFVNGYIHWLVSKPIDFSVIVAFDLAEDKFYEFPPPSIIGNFMFNRLVELGGCLCMFRTGYNNVTDVWIMKDYGNKESWTKFTITDPEEAEFRPLCMLGQEQVVLMKDEDTDDEKLVKYNLEEGTFKDIVVHGTSVDFEYSGIFIESLVSTH